MSILTKIGNLFKPKPKPTTGFSSLGIPRVTQLEPKRNPMPTIGLDFFRNPDGSIQNKVLDTIKVFSTPPTSMTQTAKPSFLESIVGGINKVTSKLELGTINTNSKVDQNTLFIIGGIAIAVAFMFSRGRRR